MMLVVGGTDTPLYQDLVSRTRAALAKKSAEQIPRRMLDARRI